MGQYTLEGPQGVDITQGATVTMEFSPGTKLVTGDTSTTNYKHRIYRYCKSHAALTVGEVKILTSNWEATMALTSAIGAAAVAPVLLGVAQVAAASASGALYGWMQTGGWFNNIGCVNASANAQLYASSSAGYVQSGNTGNQDKIVGLSGGAGSAVATAALTADGFSKDEIYVDPLPQA